MVGVETLDVLIGLLTAISPSPWPVPSSSKR